MVDVGDDGDLGHKWYYIPMKIASLVSPENVPFPANLNNMEVSGLSIDSRSIESGSLFFAIKGASFDSNRLTGEVLAKGAVAVVTDDRATAADYPEKAVLVSDVRRAISFAAHRFYGEPSSKLRCFGVTGTNGKTSVAWALQYSLSALGEKTAYIGTLGYNFGAGEQIVQIDNTAPEPILLHSVLEKAHRAGCKNVVIEATSWGLVQYRTADVQWDCCAFTNLTRDHLDLHGDMESYESAKYRLFSEELTRSPKIGRSTVFNIDDSCGLRFYDRIRADIPGINRHSFGWSEQADIKICSAKYSLSRTNIVLRNSSVGEIQLETQLIGSYNVMNLAAAFGCLVACGVDARSAAKVLESVPSVPGRMERIVEKGICIVIDYAHTPDALEKLHLACREITSGRLISVFGAGGDRDRGKRPVMGEVVARLADHCVVTSDNPRTEDPHRIVADILPGMAASGNLDIELDRSRAIHHAIQLAKPGDIVIIAGKGHEDYQIIGTTKTPFSDREVALEALSQISI